MENEFKVIKRLTGKQAYLSKYSCEEIDLSKQYDYTKPIVMCFTGNSGNKLEFANGFAKAIVNTAGIENEVDVISIKYREKHSVGNIEPEDVVKFVVGTMMDLQDALDFIKKQGWAEQFPNSPKIYFSPVFGQIEMADIVDFMKDENLQGVRLQVQLHKIIWDVNKRGV